MTMVSDPGHASEGLTGTDSAIFLANHHTLAGEVVPEVREGSQISPHDIATRIQAAGAAGYRGIGLANHDLAYWAGRYGCARIRGWLTDAGIEVVELEMLHDWYAEGAARAASNELAAQMLEWAGELRATHLKVGTGFQGHTTDRPHLVAGLNELCAKAAEVEVAVGLEPMLVAMARTPQEGLDLIEEADVPNAGLVIDTWHLVRAGVDYEAIRHIPAHRITCVELVDGLAEPAEGDIYIDAIEYRRPAGSGEFHLDRFLDALLETGFEGPYGDENLSTVNRARTVQQAAEVNFTAASEAVARARLRARADSGR